MEGDELPDRIDLALAEDDIDYRITYSPEREEVFIRIPNDAKNREGIVRLFDLQGKCLATGSADQPLSVAGLPRGVYLLGWTVQGHSRSIKFVKR